MVVPSTTSSNAIPEWKYQIFMSFRGEDTRNNFTDHLFNALKRGGFKIYKDDEDLEKGAVISDELLTAIEESLLSIVIISKNYASSTWCLIELVKILESRKKFGRKVLPIFYGVDPAVVRYQTGRFEEAFKKHEKRYTEEKEKTKKKEEAEDREKIQRWKDALKEVANLSGIDSKNRRETKLIEEIVADVWIKVQPELPSFSKELVGIDSRVKHVYSLLGMGFPDIRFIGIWGMGGIGKTTLAEVVFQYIHREFEICCFLANVTEVSGERGDGLVRLQSQLLSLLHIRSMVIKTLEEGKDIMRNQLCRRKVLLVLDDVSVQSQLETLAGKKEWFGPGSRIIVTTRDMQLLKSHGISETYEVEILNEREALQLFRKKVSRINQHSKLPPRELSSYVVEQAGGLPLALIVLSSFLCGRDMIDWKDAVDLLKQDSHGDIHKILRISYDKLGQMEKEVFLDIACFFVGKPIYFVMEILESCGFRAKICINVLIEKSLVTCDDGHLEMHDLLQEMGKSIAGKERSNEIAKWSRLWSLKDINEVLRNNTINESIEAMALKLPIGSWEDVPSHPEMFSNLSNLRLLIVSSDLSLPHGLKCLPSGLKVLVWQNYPLKDLPLQVQLDKLARLEMPNSKIRQLWNETHLFSELEILNLNGSKDLIETSSFVGTPKLKRLHLKGCTSLVEVDPSFGQHNKLVEVDFSGCTNLGKLPIKLEMTSLEKLSLKDCPNVKKLPEFGENMVALKQLILDGTAITELPQSLGYLTGLRTLSLKFCKDIIFLPNTIIGNLCSLSMIELCGCIFTDEPVTEDVGSLTLLEYLKTSGNSFVNIPCGRISKLLELRQLYMALYGRLKSLPKLPTCMYNACTCVFDWIEPSYSLEKSGFLDTVKFKEAGPRPKSKVPLEFQCIFHFTTRRIPAWAPKEGKFQVWFNNLNYFVPDRNTLKGLVPNHLLSKSSAVSIIRDIPDFCHGNKCWKIFECLVFDDLVPSHSEDLELCCYSEAFGADNKYNLELGNVCINRIRAYQSPYILIICCSINGWPYNQKKLKLTFYTRPPFSIPPRRGQILKNIIAELRS